MRTFIVVIFFILLIPFSLADSNNSNSNINLTSLETKITDFLLVAAGTTKAYRQKLREVHPNSHSDILAEVEKQFGSVTKKRLPSLVRNANSTPHTKRKIPPRLTNVCATRKLLIPISAAVRGGSSVPSSLNVAESVGTT